MSLPQRVEEQLKAAEALEAADKAAREQSAAPVVADAAQLLVVPETPPVSAPPQAPATPAAPAAPVEDFQHKYKVLQGMYNADVVKLRAQVSDLTEVIQRLQTQSPAPSQEPASTVDPKDIETFGEEMMGMVQRYVTGAVKVLEARVAAVEQAVNGVAQSTAETSRQQFYTLLTKLVPDWREVNVDEGWLTWLGQADDVYGVPRQSALDNAFKHLDAQRVANVFTAFKAAQPRTPAPPSLEAQVSPSGAGGSSAPAAPAAKPVVSERAIQAFYKDLALGAYAGRDAEANAIEAQINAAVAEGRVR